MQNERLLRKKTDLTEKEFDKCVKSKCSNFKKQIDKDREQLFQINKQFSDEYKQNKELGDKLFKKYAKKQRQKEIEIMESENSINLHRCVVDQCYNETVKMIEAFNDRFDYLCQVSKPNCKPKDPICKKLCNVSKEFSKKSKKKIDSKDLIDLGKIWTMA